VPQVWGEGQDREAQGCQDKVAIFKSRLSIFL
jgi:hypothetical protein